MDDLLKRISEVKETDTLELNELRDILREEHQTHIRIIPILSIRKSQKTRYTYEIENENDLYRNNRSEYYKALYSAISKFPKMI